MLEDGLPQAHIERPDAPAAGVFAADAVEAPRGVAGEPSELADGQRGGLAGGGMRRVFGVTAVDALVQVALAGLERERANADGLPGIDVPAAAEPVVVEVPLRLVA